MLLKLEIGFANNNSVVKVTAKWLHSGKGCLWVIEQFIVVMELLYSISIKHNFEIDISIFL